LIIYLDNYQDYGERVPMKGVISGAGVTHFIAFGYNPFDPKENGYDSDRICDMLDKVQIF
jgi:hypothetical protein